MITKKLLSGLLLIPLLTGCASNKTEKQVDERPNFVIFIADDLSWNDFGCTGNPDVKTPNIDRLAENGLTFTNAYLTASSCSPSRTSMLTCRYPHNTGAPDLHTEPQILLPSFPGELKKSGYYTVASGKWHAGEILQEGFCTNHFFRKLVTPSGAERWIEAVRDRPKDRPFMFWAAAIDPHRGWGVNDFSGTHDPVSLTIPPSLTDTPETREDLANFYDEITRFDYNIGEVIKELERQNVLDNTMIIVMADNGRPFPRAKTLLIDDGIKTPFILSWNNGLKQKGIETESLISSIDIGATLVDLAGLQIPETFQGRSFAKVIEDPSLKFRNYAFAERNWHDYEALARMVRSNDYLFILNKRVQFMYAGGAGDVSKSPSYQALVKLYEKGELSTPEQIDFFRKPRNEEELYDPKNDPHQLNNLAGLPEYQEIRKELRQVLDTWMKETGDNDPGNTTKDWYHRLKGTRVDGETNYLIGERGEMAGEATNADRINNSGPF
jgi:N-sulfoglucosamine sulfohydrolase